VIPYRADDADDPTSAIPFVTIALIVANFIVFFYELSLSPDSSQLDNFIRTYSLVPCEYTLQCTQAGTPSPVWITLLTSMFLHAGWAHILGNMVFLFVFGLHVERSMGGVRYLIFYLLCGLGASAFEIVVSDPDLSWQAKPLFIDCKEVQIELGAPGKMKKIFDGRSPPGAPSWSVRGPPCWSCAGWIARTG